MNEDNRAWYRKYRPVSFDDYIGEDIKHIVENRFTVKENQPSVIMLEGERGCGKTTFARIISKYYLCENPTNGVPCEDCEICSTINEVLISGEVGVDVPGVVEIDATTANGKDAIQQILDDAVLEPMYTRKKILILDEAHMITPQAQNSMLKVIEDIPEHLVVIFATTRQDKVIGTIHSRCQLKIGIKKKSVSELAERLEYIASQENLVTSKRALEMIAKKADRVPREAINLLEDIAKNYGNEVTVKNVVESIGDVASEMYVGFYESSNKGLEDILVFSNKLKEQNISTDKFIKGLIRFTLDGLYIRHGINIDDYEVKYLKQINKLFAIYNSNEFDMLLQIIENALKMVSEDDTKNELVIITTAMRVGKLENLMNSLSGHEIQVESEKESKKSIKRYREEVDKELEKQFDDIEKFSPTKEKLVTLLNTVTDVSSTEGMSMSVVEEPEKKEDKDFYSVDELEKMIEG